MKLITTTAIAVIAVALATPAAAQSNYAGQQQQQNAPAAQAAPSVKPSSKAAKALSDLQDSVNKKDYASVPAKVAAAEAVATTKEDHYLVGRLQLSAAVAANDNAGIVAGIDKIAASGVLSAAQTSSLYSGLGGTYFNNKQYAEAAAAYQKAIALNPGNQEAAKLLPEALYASGQKAEAATAFQKMIQASVAAGQKLDENDYRMAVQSAYDSKLPIANDIAREWVAAYPSASSWSNAIAIYDNLNQPDVEGLVDLLRLKQATGSLKDGAEYAQYARAAAELNNFNEAQSAFDAGVAAKAIDPSKSEYSDIVQLLKVKPKATAADLAEATKTATSGMALLRIGDRYYAMGDYAKAVELYKMAMGKPGVDASVANLHVGMALARSGDKAGATAALNAVNGPYAGIAKYWLLYTNQKA